MPLFVNGAWFNPALKKEEQPSAHKKLKEEYDRFMLDASNFRYPVELRVARVKKKPTDSVGAPVQPPTDNLNYRQSVLTDDGTEAWVYQKKFPNKKDGEYQFKDMGEWIRGSLRIQANEKEKLFYFFKKSGRVGTPMATLIHHDPEAIARRRAEEGALKSQLWFHVYNNEAPLVKDRKRMREVALSFGVKGVSKMSDHEVQNALFDAVSAGDDVRTRGVRKFLEAIEDKDTSTKQAKIQEAVDKGIITYNTAENEWRFVSQGKETATICKLYEDHKGSKVDALLEHLAKDPFYENRILIATRTGKLTELKPEDVSTLTKHERDRECRIAGISFVGPGRTKDVIEEELRDWVAHYNWSKAQKAQKI